MKTPPDRSGIIFEVGAQLEARDRLKNWYPATIEKIDYDKECVLIHYRQWSRRHDEWFQWSSPYLRPLERVSLRRRGLSPPSSQLGFVCGTKVLACWTDCRFYPAKILSVNRDGTSQCGGANDSYTVRFFDGVVRTVKPTKVKPFPEKSRSDKSTVGSEGWEEGESEEENGAERVEEEEEVEEKVTSEEMEGAAEEGKREAEPSSSNPPVKTRADESRGSGVPNEPITADTTHPALCHPAHIDREVLLERQAHLPTTHKFSREPLYRVIKNQPPPILSIELDHNPFKCPAAGCTKSFRKASLLHYHIKYYHSDQPDERGGEPQAQRRKRSPSKGRDFGLNLKSEDHDDTYHHDDREQSAVATAGAREDGGGEETGGPDRRDRKNFLRVKLKKKKKKKRKKRKKSQLGFRSSDDENSDQPPITLKLSTEHPSTPGQVEDDSDWSTLTAESGEDTSSWPVAMETEECEVVRCVCEVDEENDFMIQCEACLCWQHGTCMGLYEDAVPPRYVCYSCPRPGRTGWRRAQRLLAEPDWLVSGHMFGLSCVKANYSEINSSKICHTSRLLAHIHGLHQVLSGLQLQVGLLGCPSHPDLQLWRLPWRQEEDLSLTLSPRGRSPLCYVSNEHCYQKPGASWEKEERDRSPAEEEQKEVNPDDAPHRRPATHSDTPHMNTHRPHTHTPALTQEPRAASVAECQLNLLDHVESLHHRVSTRMDLIERELDDSDL